MQKLFLASCPYCAFPVAAELKDIPAIPDDYISCSRCGYTFRVSEINEHDKIEDREITAEELENLRANIPSKEDVENFISIKNKCK